MEALATNLLFHAMADSNLPNAAISNTGICELKRNVHPDSVSKSTVDRLARKSGALSREESLTLCGSDSTGLRQKAAAAKKTLDDA